VLDWLDSDIHIVVAHIVASKSRDLISQGRLKKSKKKAKKREREKAKKKETPGGSKVKRTLQNKRRTPPGAIAGPRRFGAGGPGTR